MTHQHIAALCKRFGAHLINVTDTAIHVAVVEHPAQELLDALRFSTQKQVDIECWSAERMEKQQRPPEASPLLEEGVQVVDWVNQTLNEALARRASDIHFEPGEDRYQVRLRIDGVLHPAAAAPARLASTITARLKVLGNLDIAERRVPQDGQFSIMLGEQKVSFRISTLPCRHGEKVVLRLQHQGKQHIDAEALGMSASQLGLFRHTLTQPQGLVLVTGPTGSGKTMTLYSALGERNQPDVNICSVEDPIELPLHGLNQTQIHPKAGLTFQAILRALLRQDPDIIMVGEIRDGETAEIALNAAQTGHLVLSTLHTNSTTETLVRLEQMGVARWMLASALKLVVAQRLVRRLCPHCRSLNPEPVLLAKSAWPRPLPDWKENGCERCYAGFYGRIALFEMLHITPELSRQIVAGAPASDIETLAHQQGMKSLFDHGLRAVEEGRTTLDEVYRVLGMPHDE